MNSRIRVNFLDRPFRQSIALFRIRQYMSNDSIPHNSTSGQETLPNLEKLRVRFSGPRSIGAEAKENRFDEKQDFRQTHHLGSAVPRSEPRIF